MRPTRLFILTWTSLVLSALIFIMSILDLALWMNTSAAAVTVIYHICVIVLSARANDVTKFSIFTSIPSAGCASILVLAWIAAFAMTILAMVLGRDMFPGPVPLIPEAFRSFHIAQIVLTGVETLLMVAVAKLSGYPHTPSRARSALEVRIALGPLSSSRVGPAS
ncbi:hypothetical protein B0H10DRAFT_931898 [Mycena sp. CBHHK59/15]|nr:hypothetical protein B0H10DRAFT_931898 [Mycena sp. CBHHK59/15]